MIDGKKSSDQSTKNNVKTLEILEKLLLVKQMITQLVVY